MATLSGEGLSPAVIDRILHFLNSVKTVEDITSLEHLTINDANDFFVGDVVAQRILDKRAEVGGKFADLAQLSDIKGFGEDKFNDLVEFFSGLTAKQGRRFPKTDLFRFMTIRAPKPLSTAGLQSSNVLLDAPKDDRVLRGLSRERISDDIPTADALQRQFPELWAWSSWLNQNRHELHAADLSFRASGVPIIMEDDLMKIWRALLHTVYHPKGSDALRETCLLLLIGNHTLKAFRNEEQTRSALLQDSAYWRRLANTTVVLPSSFGKEKQISFSGRKAPRPIPARDKKQRAIHQGLVAEQEMDRWSRLITEVGQYAKAHLQEEEAREAAAYKKYLEQVRPIYEQYDRDRNQSAKAAEGSPTLPPGEYPNNLVPDFEFEFVPALDKGAMKGKLSTVAQAFVEQEQLTGQDTEDALQRLQRYRRKAQKNANQRFQKNIRELRISNIPLQVKDYYSYAISPDRFGISKKAAPHALYFSFNAGYNNAFFKNFNAEVELNGKILSDKQPELISNNSGVLLVRVFADQDWSAQDQGAVVFKAAFELDNGKSFELEKAMHLRSDLANGLTAPKVNLHKEKLGLSTEVQLAGVTRLGIADFRKVEQELCCYVPGEVSHIENIMAREYKEKATRQLTRSETTLELTTEKEVEEQNDTTTTNRFEMHSEVAEVIKRDRSTNFGYNASVEGEYKFPAGSINASAGLQGAFDIANSTQTSNKNARTYAEEVTRRALERIVQKTTSKRTSTLLKEFEQNFKHGYDNRSGDEHVTGVYRWVDKVYKNQVVNYGKRLMYEFMVPEPAEFFYEVFYGQAEDNNDSGSGSTGGNNGGNGTLVAPTPLSDHGIHSAEDITRDNYSGLAAIYGVSVNAPQDEFIYPAVNLTGNTGASDDKPKSHNFNLVVPPEYNCTRIAGSTLFHYKAQKVWPFPYPECYFKVAAAGKNYRYNPDPEGKGSKTANINFTGLNTSGSIQVSVSTRRITSFNGSLTATCELKDSVFDQWQNDVYQALASAYAQQLQAYQDAVAAAQAAADAAAAAAAAEQEGNASDRTAHAGLNSQLVLTELKRLCIEMLTRPFGITMGGDFYTPGECDVPELLLTDALDKHAAIVKFFEQAFDWELMAYLFYPYYWAHRCDWQDLMKRQNGKDYFFEQFLQAGMSRVVVPVRQGFEDAVIHYMSTGEIWNGTGLTIDDPLFLSILEELAEPDGTPVGDPWYTTVPSTLNIIQGKSAYLEEEGLPCCHEDLAEHGPTNILPSNDLLEGKE